MFEEGNGFCTGHRRPGWMIALGLPGLGFSESVYPVRA